VVHLNPRDYANHFIGDRIDDVDVIARTVGLDNTDLILRRHKSCAQNDRRRDYEIPTQRVIVRHQFLRECYFAV
jgi:hypothetical protein